MINDSLKTRFADLEKLAKAAGLDYFDVHFFEVPSHVIWQTAACGLPTRYSHWSFGGSYLNQQTQAEMGFSKIYELIIHNDPAIALLDKNNTETVNLLIAVHCLAHSAFFKHNILFRMANENKMVDIATQHASIIDQFRNDYGDDEVDEWLDIALSMEGCIDFYKGYNRKRYPKRNVSYKNEKPDGYEFLDKTPKPLVKKIIEGLYVPPIPEKDMLWFFHEYANLESWQKKIFEIVRKESFYFFPMRRTKIANEGFACIVEKSLVLTDNGLITIKSITDQKFDNINIATGLSNVSEQTSFVHVTSPMKTIKLKTDKGISLEGAEGHRLFARQKSSNEVRDVFLKDLKVGDFVCIKSNTNIWPQKYIEIDFTHPSYSRSKDFRIPEIFDEYFAEFLGYFISEGCFADRSISIVNKDLNIINRFVYLSKKLFNIEPSVVPRTDYPDKFDATIHCSAVAKILEDIGIDLDKKSSEKEIPNFVLRSPKNVVSKFMAAYFDGDGGCYNDNQIVLASSSELIMEQFGILLNNFGIKYGFSHCKKDGYKDTFQIRIHSLYDLQKFSKEIGFVSSKKKIDCCKRILKRNYVHNKIKKNDYVYAKITNIEYGFDICYDLTIPIDQHYIAQSFINHNSYWHAELMKQYAMGSDNDYNAKLDTQLSSEEHLDFVSYHEKVVQPGLKIPLKVEVEDMDINGRKKKIKIFNPKFNEHPSLFNAATRINPYYVGFKILRDIKKRWDKYKEIGYYENEWGEKIPVNINGDQKVFEVIKEEDDVSLLSKYLTEDLASELHLFTMTNSDKYNDNYGYQESKNEPKNAKSLDSRYVDNNTIIVKSKEYNKISDYFSKKMANSGSPQIVIRRVDSDGLLRLEHLLDDIVNLDIGYSEHVLKYIYVLWKRPVELVRKDKKANRTWIMTYDGNSFDIDHETIDYPDVVEAEQLHSSL